MTTRRGCTALILSDSIYVALGHGPSLAYPAQQRTNNIASNDAMRCSTPTRKGLTCLAAKSPARQASPTTRLIGANDLTPHSLLYVETNNAPVSGNRGRAAVRALRWRGRNTVV